MGHDHHFLSRLDRLSPNDTEFALLLYRDADLVRALLHRIELPDGVERVALALHENEQSQSAHIIVQRNGHFVTCLAPGMHIGDLPRVTRARVDSLITRREDLRRRFEIATERSKKDGSFKALGTRLVTDAERISREDYLALSAVLPLEPLHFFEPFLKALQDLEHYDTRRRELLRSRTQAEMRVLRRYHQRYWTAAHQLVLCGSEDSSVFAHLVAERPVLVAKIAQHGLARGTVPLATRCVWATARIGKPLLPTFKKLARNPSSHDEFIASVLTLVAMACKSQKLLPEIRKSLDAYEDTATETTFGRFRLWFATHLDSLQDDPERPMRLVRELGRQFWVDFNNHRPRSAPFMYEHPSEVPDDIAIPFVGMLPFHLFNAQGSHAMLITTYFSAVMARLPPEMFFLPDAALRAWNPTWRPQTSYDLINAAAHPDRILRPIRVEQSPGRNDPCHCNSGKKFKKCCGA